MKPVPVDLVLHTLAAHLSDPEGTVEAIALGQAIYSYAVNHRALPGQWCADYADPEPQTQWLARRITCWGPARVSADTRVLEVEVARRLADAGLALLVTQDDEDFAAATLLLDASRRVVGLERGQEAAELTITLDGAVAYIERLKADRAKAGEDRDAYAAERDTARAEADMLRRERDTALRDRVTDRDEHEVVVRNLKASADVYARDRDAHARDFVRARDELNKLKAAISTAEENMKAACQQRDNAEADLDAIRSAYLDAAGTAGTIREIVGAVQRGATWQNA